MQNETKKYKTARKYSAIQFCNLLTLFLFLILLRLLKVKCFRDFGKLFNLQSFFINTKRALNYFKDSSHATKCRKMYLGTEDLIKKSFTEKYPRH